MFNLKKKLHEFRFLVAVLIFCGLFSPTLLAGPYKYSSHFGGSGDMRGAIQYS